MCEDRRTSIEQILDEQKETNSLLRQIIASDGLRITVGGTKPTFTRDKIKEIQRILNVPVDGIMGPQTRRAFNYLEK